MESNAMVLHDGYSPLRVKTQTVADFRPMTPDEAKALTYGERVKIKTPDGMVREVKINGAPKTWKRDPSRVEVPVKYGMYEYATMVARDGRMVEWGGSGAMLLIQLSDWRKESR